MKLRARDNISPEEEAFIRAGVKSAIKAKAGQVVVRDGQALDVSMILLSGIAARRKDIRDGRRQYTELHVAGDFTDLHSFTLKHLDHDIVALSNCTFALIPHTHLNEMTDKYPHLTRVYWFCTNLDACIHREWELCLGSRNAMERLAHLFCEMYLRLEIVGLVRGCTYDLPVSQVELAEMVGITSVHTNRTLQEMRRQGLVEFARGMITINDIGALKQAAKFDDSYLYLPHQIRR